MKDRLVADWQAEIIADCVHRLGRKLTPKEEFFVRSCEGLLALESTHDMVKGLIGPALEKYLASPPARKPN
ncbi:MAG: hypothetical protein A2049_08230 [Elusimicrobia bacterium GWA2_62_23]|nr:MAG: hypothetical protein A2049_08230 [Elusimicrobia bacterium GWA2_62_23]OGR70708.1 MAG: hypothetical protein A2179_03250 [Elusimicrobia bacterium GWC2_63_65]